MKLLGEDSTGRTQLQNYGHKNGKTRSNDYYYGLLPTLAEQQNQNLAN